jgi:hypothetical protein
MADDGGVLGNLPRSRPGHRSEKRTEKTAAKAAARAERSGAKAASPPGGAKAASPTGAPKAASGPRSGSPRRAKGAPTTPKPAGEDRTAARAGDPSAGRAGDPVGDAIRTVAGVASTGAKVAGGVAREVIRRLPRP